MTIKTGLKDTEWNKLKFEDLLIEPVRNGIYKKKEFHGRGARIVNMGELFAYPRLGDVEMKRVELTENEISKVLLQTGDLLFARRSLTAEGAGKCSIVKEVLEPTTFESSIIRARPDSSVADSDFLYYFFNSPHGKYLLGTIRREVAVSGITGSDLKTLQLEIPSLKAQKTIAKICSNLDDKILLNHQINQTLESMAQAIFKSWFVDFEPVKAKIAAIEEGKDSESINRAAMRAISGKTDDELDKMQAEKPDEYAQLEGTAKLFPAAMWDSELGEVPEGWEIIPFSKLAKLDTTSVKPHTEPLKLWEHYSIPAFDANEAPSFELGSEIKSNKYKVNSTAILSSKLNPNTPRTWWPDVDDSNNAICSTEFMQFIPANETHRAFIFSLVTSDTFQSGIKQRVTGSTGSRQRAQPRAIAEMDVIKPKDNIIQSFCLKLADLFHLRAKNIKENQNLSNLRDTLLPKLLSGELQVADAEVVVKE
jgi:Restriction endonuclease S subunits